MVRGLVAWTRAHRIMAVALLLLTGVFAVTGILLYRQVKVLLAPRPPVFVTVVAHFPGASAEEVERQVAIPLEVTLAGKPLKATYSRSQAGLAWLDCEFEAGVSRDVARQEVINRLQMMAAPLPPGVIPLLSASPTFAEPVLRYTLSNPENALGHPIYTRGDLQALQEWHLGRVFRRQPGVVDVASDGGAVKRYEVHLDPDRLKRYGITVRQLMDSIDKSNANVGGDFFIQGQPFQQVRNIGAFGGGRDPMEDALGMKTPEEAADYLRVEDNKRLREIRNSVITVLNNVAIQVGDLVGGGPLAPGQAEGVHGVVVGRQPRTGIVAVSRPRMDAQGAPARDADGKPLWIIEPDAIQGIVFMRKEPEAARWFQDLSAKIKQFNEEPGTLLPGVKFVTYAGPEAGFFIHGLFPGNLALEQVAEKALDAHAVLRGFAEVDAVVSETGRGDYYGVGLPNEVESFVALKPPAAWPAPAGRDRPRAKEDLLKDVQAELTRQMPGVAWCCSAHPGLGSMEPFAPAADECLVKIFGPDLAELDKLAGLAKPKLEAIAGITNVRLFPVMGQASLAIAVDRDKCARLGIQVADVMTHIEMAVSGKAFSRMVEGEKIFDISLHWAGKAPLLEVPVVLPPNPADLGPRLRLRDLVTPVDRDGQPAAGGEFVRAGPVCVYRENGQRLVSLKFRVKGRSPADVLAAAQAATADLFPKPYRAEWLAP